MILAEITNTKRVDWHVLKITVPGDEKVIQECTALQVGELMITIIDSSDGVLELRIDGAEFDRFNEGHDSVRVKLDHC